MAMKNQNLIAVDQGLIDKVHWADCLRGYPTELFLDIRHFLRQNVDGLSEKFNRNSRYFGYRKKDGSDVLYIYVQKHRLRIDLNIDRKYKAELQKLGFTVNYVNNFQGRAGWLTGWQVPHDMDKTEQVKNWIHKAFE